MKKGQNKCVMEVQINYLKNVPSDDGDFLLKWSFSNMKGVIENLKCSNRTITGTENDIIEVLCNEVKLYGTKITKQNLKFMLIQNITSQKKKKEINFGTGFIDLSPFTTIRIKREISIKIKAEKSDFSFECHLTIWNKDTLTDITYANNSDEKKVKMVGFKQIESEEEEENIIPKKIDNSLEIPRTLEDMVNDIDEETDEQLMVVTYPPSTGPIDLQEIFDSLKNMKGDFDSIDNFIELLKKWWSDNDAHIELNIIPISMEDWIDCVWLIKTLETFKVIKFGFEEENNIESQCKLQIEKALKDTKKRLTKLVQERVEGMLKNLILSTAFDSTKSNFEEGIATAYVRFISSVYESVCKISSTYANSFIRQLFHFSIYSIFEGIVDSHNVDGSKGFQLNYFGVCIQNEMDQVTVLRKYREEFIPIIEVSRLLTMPLDVDLMKLKEEVFPTVKYNLLLKILQEFKPGNSNPNPIPKSVFKFLSKHLEQEPIPSKYDLIEN
ncbi:hypothetical protein EHI8A_024300 [Entamoeba histolytica HM-1:IMSS-B]|uniref:Dilute domain-containing protein n=6 Tax=Entamoeba histolytica TaxID=5759 RepID=C4M5V6_ENTH1|nr:hypothetical protein EHI_026400 [Entamoeba histolytica HM-1:IMSS]EMD42927.1 Hypothetical protein EHI5A_047480 [Entamoeba histolytica KU27]EMH75249.1 hypothetical protein EHI8A_024300 [Entamoeba histolytica HM-1:IMSS-B]EMS17694.1 hypothetical protein KM1_040250 [Entamoeba histolytica HM-3:IMSS]ENY63130.1 hypothetical protein EHI7A_027070 [Entamoeba histolytica HM-1:IMSS-A]GAT96829.1 hypothetical protein CL6EHI_026400 [Entamoeba histolytica]|eukprot:XP_655379.1 hypothetical protein EHI_026400 [Entamoeba histolytica HM-1:IMSS]